jgi:hypothetical protein
VATAGVYGDRRSRTAQQGLRVELTGVGPRRSVSPLVKGVDPRMAQKRFIHEFLNELEVNQELSDLYESDHQAAMESYGLDAEQQEVLLEGSNQQIRAVLKEEMKTHIAYVIRMG